MAIDVSSSMLAQDLKPNRLNYEFETVNLSLTYNLSKWKLES